MAIVHRGESPDQVLSAIFLFSPHLVCIWIPDCVRKFGKPAQADTRILRPNAKEKLMNALSIKTLFIITVTTLLFTAGAAAQNGQGNGGDRTREFDRGAQHGPADAETRVAHMTRMLDLSDEQSAELLEIMQAVDRERMALHEQAFQELEPEICTLQLNIAAEIKNILTDDQLALLEAKKSEREKDRFGKSWRGMQLDCSAYE
jgi:hypothetical protein